MTFHTKVYKIQALHLVILGKGNRLRNKKLENSKRRGTIIGIFQLFSYDKTNPKMGFYSLRGRRKKSSADFMSILQPSTVFRLQVSGICNILEEIKISL